MKISQEDAILIKNLYLSKQYGAQLYQRKFTEFWLMTVDAAKNNPRTLWRSVNQLLQPRTDVTTQALSADDSQHISATKSMLSAAPRPIVLRLS